MGSGKSSMDLDGKQCLVELNLRIVLKFLKPLDVC